MIAPVRAIDVLRRTVAEAWRPRKRVAPDVWIEQHVVLNEDYEASRGAYDLKFRPWFREILILAGDSSTRTIRLKCSTQIGKTLVLCALLCYLSDNAPASAMVVLPDRDAGAEFRDRLYALAESSGIAIPPTWKWNTRHCDVGDMRIFLAWPRSRQRVRGRRCKYVFRSEIDVYAETKSTGDPIEASNRRVKAYARHLILDESTPIPEVSRIEKLEAASNQLRWWAKCPHCGTYQVPRFFPNKEGRGGVVGYRTSGGGNLPPVEAKKQAFYACVTGCCISNLDKPRFMGVGKALPKSQRFDSDGTIVGEPTQSSDIGIHLWAAHSGDSWGDIAAEYVTAVTNGKVPDFWQNVLGKEYRAGTRTPTWKELGTRLSYWNKRGTVPSQAYFLTAGADVQDREVYVSVRAWGDQRTSWLVDWFVFNREPGDDAELIKTDLKQINAVLSTTFPVVNQKGDDTTNPIGKSGLKIFRMGIDANHRTLDVHNWKKSLLDQDRVLAVRGEHGIKAADKYKRTTVFEAKRPTADGKKIRYEGGLELVNLNPDVFRSDLTDRFLSRAGVPGAWHVCADMTDIGEFYLRQVVNEVKVVGKGKDGRTKVEWKERDTQVGHDFWDTEVYSSAIAQMVVDAFDGRPGWDAGKWKIARTDDRRRPKVDDIGAR